jgi:predicted TPR repeat methyltransferase
MTDRQHYTAADRAEELFRAGRPEEAIDLSRRMCQAPEASADDWFLYGCLSADTGDTGAAMAALGKAAELEPDYAEAQLALGKLLAASGDHAAAMNRLEKAAELQPDNADIWLMLGIAHGLAGEVTRAEECCRQSLALQPRSAQAHFNLANALQAQGKSGDAEVEYEAALELDPGLIPAWSMLSQVRISRGKLAEAEAAARQAIALDPRFGAAHFTLGGILEARGEIQQARQHYAQAAELLPDFPEAHLRLGMLLAGLGEHSAAVESYQRAVNLKPDLAEAFFLMGESFRVQRLFGKAEANYRKAVALNNDHLQAHYRLALGLLAAKHHDEAAKHFEEILRINPNDEQARHLLAAQRAEAPPTAPAAYVATLFDEVADSFDARLVGTLQYRIPERLHELVRQRAAPAAKSLDVIDLGCGTGLCAPLIRGMARTLHGVDLSPRMVEKARERNLYDSLEVGDIAATLQSRTAAWDLALAADVFIYLGDLHEVFSACASALRSGGYFAFSVEAGDESDAFVLRQTGRYAHSPRYIRELAAATGFQETGHRRAVVRREHGADVHGHLFLLRRPVTLPESPYRIKYFFD